MTTISSSHAADNLVSPLSSSARCMYDGLSNYKYNSPTITWQVATVKNFIIRRVFDGIQLHSRWSQAYRSVDCTSYCRY